MSDITEMLGSDTAKPAGSVIKRELERRSQDVILVNNPTDKDFRLQYDGFIHVIPSKNKDMGDGKGKRRLQRYLTENYLKHMTDKILMDEVDLAVQKENEKRKQAGRPEMNKWEEQLIFEGTISRINDPEARKEVMRVLYAGVAEKFGSSSISQERAERKSTLTNEFEFMAEMDRGSIPVSTEVENDTIEEEDLEELKAEAISGIAQ